MDLLFDTHVLVWTVSGDPRLSPKIKDVLKDPTARIFVSAVTAFEFVDLELRRRFPPGVVFEDVCDRLGVQILDYPIDAWRWIKRLPLLHLDPVDRMLVAHAIHADLTLVTADIKMRRYPVRTLW